MQLELLQMKLCLREAVERADMVVMHMGQDHIGNAIAVEADQA